LRARGETYFRSPRTSLLKVEEDYRWLEKNTGLENCFQLSKGVRRFVLNENRRRADGVVSGSGAFIEEGEGDLVNSGHESEHQRGVKEAW